MSYKDLIDKIFNQPKNCVLDEGEIRYSDNYTFSEEVFIEDVMSTLTEKEAIVLYKRNSFYGYEFRTLRVGN